MTSRKLAITPEGRTFFIHSTEKDYHTQYGYLKAEDLKVAKEGQSLASNTGKEFTVFTPTFLDLYKRIKRQAQIIPLKDVGSIITLTGINKNSTVVDSGSGSGALACFLASVCKKVTSYDIRDDHLEICQKNKEFLALKNVTFKKGNIYEGVKEKNADVLTLDVPEPWLALESAKRILKVGGFLVAYSPTIPQIADFVNAVHKEPAFIHIDTIELIERQWEILDRKVRPKTQQIGHSGFLSFVRKLR